MRVVVLMLLAVTLAGCSEEAGPADQGTDLTVDDDLQATDTTGIIRGVVVDEAVIPIVGATVTIQGQNLETQTDEEGAFGFDGLDEGVYFLRVDKLGYNSTQSNANVVAGVERPDAILIRLISNPTTAPYFESEQLRGYLACGAPVFATSVGCTTWGPIADATASDGIFERDWGVLPQHVQGELVWRNTQAFGGQFIWELSPDNWPSTPQPAWGHRDVTPSPALAYMNQTHIEGEANGEDVSDWMMAEGMNYRIFAGPNEACDGIYGFGCGLTIDQDMELFLHDFFNFNPEDGWRFTEDGDPIVPS
ncbi:MAG: carboxypeptidase-like regulatory domain-containing protein [Thermoplasmatota archaeon]